MIDVFTALVFNWVISGFYQKWAASPTTLISQSHWVSLVVTRVYD